MIADAINIVVEREAKPIIDKDIAHELLGAMCTMLPARYDAK